MFCAHCGSQLQDGALFCASCGGKVGQTPAAAPATSAPAAPTAAPASAPAGTQEVKYVLDPSEVVPQKPVKDSGSSLAGQGKTLGMILMMISIIGDLVAMCVVGFDAFIPVTIGATVLFVIGFFLRTFSP